MIMLIDKTDLLPKSYEIAVAVFILVSIVVPSIWLFIKGDEDEG